VVNLLKGKTKKLLPIVVMSLLVGLVSATVFTMYYANFTATAKTPDVRLGVGPDSGATTAPPMATVTVASTYDFATIGFTMFPSATNTPQPSTYYTNLLNITNAGATNHTINSITISSITGVANLGSITIYYYATQTDNPVVGTPVGSVTLTSSSTDPSYTLITNQGLAASAVNYIEIVAYAASTATPNTSTVTFTTSIDWV
jgi:hypothetical protein